MPVNVVEKKSDFESPQALVVVEGANYEDVTGPEAKTAALKAAQKAGYTRCGIGGSSGPYLVDEDGETIENPSTLNPLAPRMFRNDYKIQPGIGT